MVVVPPKFIEGLKALPPNQLSLQDLNKDVSAELSLTCRLRVLLFWLLIVRARDSWPI